MISAFAQLLRTYHVDGNIIQYSYWSDDEKFPISVIAWIAIRTQPKSNPTCEWELSIVIRGTAHCYSHHDTDCWRFRKPAGDYKRRLSRSEQFLIICSWKNIGKIRA